MQDTTPLVRSDPAGVLSETQAWDVTVQPGAGGLPIAVDDSYATPFNVPLAIAAPGVLEMTTPTAAAR